MPGDDVIDHPQYRHPRDLTQTVDILARWPGDEGLLADAAQNGQLRDDVAPDELATYCLHALGAATGLHSEAAVRRLVSVTLDGLRTPSRRMSA